MTKQSKPEERNREIIAAALQLLDEVGLRGFTMEAVIARTPLSKGGVYRFYGNKHELLVGVLEHLASALQPTSQREALAWQLPLGETLLRLIFASLQDPEGLRLWRIHLQLMPELPHDAPLLVAMRERFDRVLVDYREIVLAIIERDHLRLRPGFEVAAELVIRIGQSLTDGLLLNALGGMPLAELEHRLRGYLDLALPALIADFGAAE